MNVIELSSLARRLREVALAASQQHGDSALSVAELAVIQEVARTPGTSVTGIARTTGLAQSWVSTIVHSLCQEGVFVQSKDPVDQRRTLISLSGFAQQLTFSDRGGRGVEEAVGRAFPHLDEVQVQYVMGLLAELQKTLEAPRAEKAR